MNLKQRDRYPVAFSTLSLSIHKYVVGFVDANYIGTLFKPYPTAFPYGNAVG